MQLWRADFRLPFAYFLGGEKDDLWQQSVTAEPVDQFVKEIYGAGFRGIYLNMMVMLTTALSLKLS